MCNILLSSFRAISLTQLKKKWRLSLASFFALLVTLRLVVEIVNSQRVMCARWLAYEGAKLGAGTEPDDWVTFQLIIFPRGAWQAGLAKQ